MIKNYLNKEAKINVAFSSWGSGGSCPVTITGKVINVNDEYVEIEFNPSNKENLIPLRKTSGKMIVRKEYIISIVLL